MVRLARRMGWITALFGLMRAFAFLFPSPIGPLIAFYSVIGVGIFGFISATLLVFADERDRRV